MAQLRILILMGVATGAGMALATTSYYGVLPVVGAAATLVITALTVAALGVAYRDAGAARTQLDESERGGVERFRAVIDNAHDAIIAIDSAGRIETFNRAAERIFGYTPAEVIGKNVNILMPQPFKGAHDGYIRNYITTGAAKIIGTGREVRAQRKSGEVFPIDLSIGEMNVGAHRGFIGIIRDISARKSAEDARDDAERRVRELTGELLHVSRLSAMGELASSLAHELNQPLTAIMNYSEAAQAMIPASPDKAREYMQKTGVQADRAGQIIRRLRGFVGKGAVERAPVRLNEVVEEASTFAAVGAKLDAVDMQFAFDAELPPVKIDRIQIQQVVVNLVRNAVDVLHEAATRRIMISTRLVEDGLQEVAVADSGPGIAREIADRLFMPFTTTKQSGMGIGLSISRSIVEAHGGRLWFEPNPGGGAVFKFTIPALKRDAS